MLKRWSERNVHTFLRHSVFETASILRLLARDRGGGVSTLHHELRRLRNGAHCAHDAAAQPTCFCSYFVFSCYPPPHPRFPFCFPAISSQMKPTCLSASLVCIPSYKPNPWRSEELRRCLNASVLQAMGLHDGARARLAEGQPDFIGKEVDRRKEGKGDEG